MFLTFLIILLLLHLVLELVGCEIPVTLYSHPAMSQALTAWHRKV